MNAAERARELLKTAAGAEQALRESVHELVTMRAWTVLGHENFSVMWKAENGFECPTPVQALAVEAFVDEGINTGTSKTATGHSRVDIAKGVGLPLYTHPRGYELSDVASWMVTQILHGVPADRVVRSKKSPSAYAVIAEHGNIEPGPRSRAKPRRLGTAPDEYVNECFGLRRYAADEIAEVARQANLPKAEIYRQAVAEYLDRLREAKKVAS